MQQIYNIIIQYMNLLLPENKQNKSSIQTDTCSTEHNKTINKITSSTVKNQINQFPLQQQPNNIISHPKRKNFKEVFMHKKISQTTQAQQPSSNYNSILYTRKFSPQKKNSIQKIQKQNIEQSTIIHELYQTSSSILTQEQFSSVLISNNIESNILIKPFKLVSIEQPQHAKIPLNYDNYQEKLQKNKLEIEHEKKQFPKIANEIKLLFDRKIPNTTNNSISIDNPKTPQQKQKPISPNTSTIQTLQPTYNSNNYSSCNTIQNFADFFHKRQLYLKKKQKQCKQRITLGNSNYSTNTNGSIKVETNQKIIDIHQKINNNSQQKYLTNLKLEKSTNLVQYIKLNNHDHHYDTAPQSQQQKLFNKYQHKQKIEISEEKQSFPQLALPNIDQNQQLMSDFNMIPQQTISSAKRKKILDHLQRQLYENQLGPYQNELQNLLQLTKQYPNQWSALLIAQKILAERAQYSQKLFQNNTTILHNEYQTLKQFHFITKQNKLIHNQYQILNMIRLLAQYLSINNQTL